ncbi:hypothetical protein PLICRDRAFT_119586 [Plicaturopsis crispa FD-325 SS-3]|uniref:Uncharacterized protein n=1 Tax=Plicaturopsis crispa FD-325 SS-3 TaxID=944288 RepID=A0A0C9T260_PLICR|nr:hypothetical protein PLICRDRAFT_119586 [Plicaturopsis crispa FD-325 SS-3]
MHPDDDIPTSVPRHRHRALPQHHRPVACPVDAHGSPVNARQPCPSAHQPRARTPTPRAHASPVRAHADPVRARTHTNPIPTRQPRPRAHASPVRARQPHPRTPAPSARIRRPCQRAHADLVRARMPTSSPHASLVPAGAPALSAHASPFARTPAPQRPPTRPASRTRAHTPVSTPIRRPRTPTAADQSQGTPAQAQPCLHLATTPPPPTTAPAQGRRLRKVDACARSTPAPGRPGACARLCAFPVLDNVRASPHTCTGANRHDQRAAAIAAQDFSPRPARRAGVRPATLGGAIARGGRVRESHGEGRGSARRRGEAEEGGPWTATPRTGAPTSGTCATVTPRCPLSWHSFRRRPVPVCVLVRWCRRLCHHHLAFPYHQ